MSRLVIFMWNFIPSDAGQCKAKPDDAMRSSEHLITNLIIKSEIQTAPLMSSFNLGVRGDPRPCYKVQSHNENLWNLNWELQWKKSLPLAYGSIQWQVNSLPSSRFKIMARSIVVQWNEYMWDMKEPWFRFMHNNSCKLLYHKRHQTTLNVKGWTQGSRWVVWMN